jgi:RNA recognition motif-containing protein
MAKKLYVGNIPYSVDSAQLQELFKEFGTVVSAVVINDKMTGRSRGFGFVEFSTDEEAMKAIEAMNGKDVQGKSLVVNEARPPKENYNRGGGNYNNSSGGGWN